jgi:hypothetical protein
LSPPPCRGARRRSAVCQPPTARGRVARKTYRLGPDAGMDREPGHGGVEDGRGRRRRGGRDPRRGHRTPAHLSGDVQDAPRGRRMPRAGRCDVRLHGWPVRLPAVLDVDEHGRERIIRHARQRGGPRESQTAASHRLPELRRRRKSLHLSSESRPSDAVTTGKPVTARPERTQPRVLGAKRGPRRPSLISRLTANRSYDRGSR